MAASPVAVQIVQYMRLSTEPVELLLEVYVGWYYSNQGLLILSTKLAGLSFSSSDGPASTQAVLFLFECSRRETKETKFHLFVTSGN